MITFKVIATAWVLTLLLQAFWAFRIFRAGQTRTYPATFSYLLFSSMAGVLTLVASISRPYFQGVELELLSYLVSRPLIWILFFAVVHEMFKVMAKEYAGLRRIGQLILYGGLGSLVLFLVTVIFSSPFSVPELKGYYRLWLIQEQSVYLATASAVMAIILIGRFFSLPLSRNLRIILGTLGIYFVGMGGLIVLRGFLDNSWNHTLDAAGLGLYFLCLAIGAFAYSSAGESVAADPRLTRTAEHLAALGIASRRLEEVNLQLVRVLAK